MKRTVVLLLLLLSLAALSRTATVDLNLDFDMITLSSTPSTGLSMTGLQLDVLLTSPGNVQMGFGMGYHWLFGSESFFEKSFSNLIELYSVASYKSEFSSVLDLFVVSRGGMAVPVLDFSTSGYFVEVSVDLVYTKGFFRAFGGLSLKSYAFGDRSVLFLPVKVGIGGEF